MASKTVVELFDDLDGSRADETVTFGLDGVEYQIDLSAEHAAALRAVLARFIPHAHRPTATRARRTPATSGSATPASTAAVSSTAVSSTAMSSTAIAPEPATPAAPRATPSPKRPVEAKPAKVINHTEEIRRLAKLSAAKADPAPEPDDEERSAPVRRSRRAPARQSAKPVAVQPTLDEQLDLTQPPAPVQQPSEPIGPAKALMIPFQEAGL